MNKTPLLIIFVFILVPAVLAADIVYILKDPQSPNQEVIQAINDLTLSYDLINVNSLSSIDFSNYKAILVWDISINNADKIPITEKNAIVSNMAQIKDWKIARSALRTISITPSKGTIQKTHAITSGLSGTFPVYTQEFPGLFIIQRQAQKAQGLEAILSTIGGSTIIGVIDINEKLYPSGESTAKTIFFGIPETKYWTPESKKLFQNSILWLLEDNIEANLPEFLPLTCQTAINEDEQYTCAIQARDLTNDPLSFSIGTSNNLNCRFLNNILTYSSEENYNGPASCELIISDKDGQSSKILDVSIRPINDAPTIESFLPLQNSLAITKGNSQQFSIAYSDIDDDALTIEWLLDSRSLALTPQYIFQAEQLGIFTLKAVVSDADSEASHSWSIIVSEDSPINPGQQTCSQQSGFICSSSQTCSGSLLQASDASSCCSIQCSQNPTNQEVEFKDAGACAEISQNLTLEISDLNEEYKLGDTLMATIELENNLDKDQDFDLEFHIYNAKDEKSVAEASTFVDIPKGRKKTRTMPIDIPQDLDLDEDFVLFVKAKDSECTQKYKEITLKRPDHNLIIEDFILPQKAFCGETIQAKVKLANLGSKDEEVSLKLENSKLKLSETKTLELEEFNQDNEETVIFDIKIPEEIEGEQTITAVASYSTNLRAEFSNKIEISCAAENTSQQVIQEQNLDNTPVNLEPITKENIQEKASLPTLLLMITVTTTILTFCFILLFTKLKDKKSKK